MAQKLGIDKNYQPEKIATIQIAALIDSSKMLRAAFLLVKKIYPKPFI